LILTAAVALLVSGAGGYYGRARHLLSYTTQIADMTSPSKSPPSTTPTFRKTLLRVMAVQVITLVMLWLLQSHYTR
jgi:hypothetical protein